MKYAFLFCLSLISLPGLMAQNTNPVTWQASYKALSKTEGEVIITATIEKGWHTYSQRPTKDGPIPTSFKYTPSKQYSLEGKTEESEAHEEFVKAFEAKIFVFHDKAVFRQKVRLTGKAADIAFKIEYMCCNDMMCLPPKTIDLSVKAQ